LRTVVSFVGCIKLKLNLLPFKCVFTSDALRVVVSLNPFRPKQVVSSSGDTIRVAVLSPLKLK